MSEPLVLIPGLMNDGDIFAHQADTLGADRDVVIGDATKSAAIAAIAADVLDAAPERFALGGLSLGGYVAFEILRRAPDRVSRLALIDTQARPDTEDARRSRLAAIHRVREGDFEAVAADLRQKLVHPARREEQALMDRLAAMMERLGPEVFLRQQQAALARPDSRPLLGTIAVPTLLIAGRQDAVTPLAVQEEMAARIEPAKLKVVEDCGHLAPIERPDAVTDALRGWLEG